MWILSVKYEKRVIKPTLIRMSNGANHLPRLLISCSKKVHKFPRLPRRRNALQSMQPYGEEEDHQRAQLHKSSNWGTKYTIGKDIEFGEVEWSIFREIHQNWNSNAN